MHTTIYTPEEMVGRVDTKLRSVVVVRVGEIASFRSAPVAMTKYYL